MNTEDLDGFTHAATVFESGQVVLYCYLVCLWPSHRSLQLRKKEKMDLVFNPAAPPLPNSISTNMSFNNNLTI